MKQKNIFYKSRTNWAIHTQITNEIDLQPKKKHYARRIQHNILNRFLKHVIQNQVAMK